MSMAGIKTNSPAALERKAQTRSPLRQEPRKAEPYGERPQRQKLVGE
jgi:hypothetical protein